MLVPATARYVFAVKQVWCIRVEYNRIIAFFRRWNTIASTTARVYPKNMAVHDCAPLWHRALCSPTTKNPSEIITSRFKVYWISFPFWYIEYRHTIYCTMSPCAWCGTSLHTDVCSCVSWTWPNKKLNHFAFRNFAKPFNAKRVWLREYKSIFVGNKIYCSCQTNAKILYYLKVCWAHAAAVSIHS